MKNNNPLISIVTPVFNAEKFILNTIHSVKNQTYNNWELILVDDKSSDTSVALIESEIRTDGRIKLIQNNRNIGAAHSRNKGTQLAKGRFLAFLDADDIWLPEKLNTQVQFMIRRETPFTYTSYKFTNYDLTSFGKKVKIPKTITYSQSLKNHIIWTSTVMLDLAFIDKATIMMPDVRRGQDAATWWQILRVIEVAHGVPEVLSYYRRTEHTLSSNKFKAMRRTWYLFRKVEKLSLPSSIYNFLWYGFNAIVKRI